MSRRGSLPANIAEGTTVAAASVGVDTERVCVPGAPRALSHLEACAWEKPYTSWMLKDDRTACPFFVANKFAAGEGEGSVGGKIPKFITCNSLYTATVFLTSS